MATGAYPRQLGRQVLDGTRSSDPTELKLAKRKARRRLTETS
jgi:hypothetical protein